MAAPRRVFFALWPGPDVAKRLHALSADAHAACGGRRMKRDTLHLTLAFLGEVDAERFELACAVADDVAARGGAAGMAPSPDMTLRIDRLAYWKHNRIVWAGCDEVPPALAALAGDLAAALREAGFALDSRPFAAHVTLLRNAACPGGSGHLGPFAAFDWPIDQFVLVQSRLDPGGAHYEIVRRWPVPGCAGPRGAACEPDGSAAA